MQLMTFNSLLMFDIVFVFFLFLVGVTCLVYYLPNGKQQPHQQQQHHHHHHHESTDEAVNCRHNRQLHCHHNSHQCQKQHNHHQQQEQSRQQHYYPQSVATEAEVEGSDTDTDSEANHLQDHEESVREHLLGSHVCQCNITVATCASFKEQPSCNSEDIAPGEVPVDLRLLERHPTPHHSSYCHRHSIQADRCLFDDPDDSDDIFYCDSDSRMSGFGILGRSTPVYEHVVVVNETDSVSVPPAPQCCYIKAKFTDVKECVGPIVDV